MIEGNLREVETLVERDPALVRTQDDDGNVALHHAVWNGHTVIAEYLLWRGTPVDSPVQAKEGTAQNGWSPLHHAAASGRVEMIALLLKAGANRDFQAADGAVALHHAAWWNHVEAAKALLDAGSSPNARRKNRVTPLESAAFFGHNAMVELLLRRGADPNARVYDGNTALHQAARNGHLEVIRLLVEAKASPNIPRDDGRTPLHIAAETGQGNALSLLLRLNADPFIKDRDDRSPLALAQAVGQGGTAAILQSYFEARNSLESERAARDALNKSLPTGKVVEKVVYQNDFRTDKIRAEWSSSPLGPHFGELRLSPIAGANRNYLGDFGNQNVRLALAKLPPHQQLTVIVDLLILNTWDGDGLPGNGPDLWEMSLTGGPLLYRGAFANFGPDTKTPMQSYPGEYPLDHHPIRTGAIAKDVAALAPVGSATTNAVYRIKVTVAHTAPYAVLNFIGKNLQELGDESWGISRIEVRTGTVAPKPR
ncbi:MAG: hypothetical protein OHK0029_06620 [Armatimonadaceae bacterium]